MSGRKGIAGHHPLVIAHLDGEDRVRDLALSLTSELSPVVAIRCDATVEPDVVAAFDRAKDLGPIKKVIFCVGGWAYPRLVELSADDIEHSVSLNLISALLVLREVARRTVDGGRVVLLSSAAAAVAPGRQITYAAAKAGLEVAARAAAKELGEGGVTVNAVRPGATHTGALRSGTSPRAIEAMTTANAMRRLGTLRRTYDGSKPSTQQE